MRDALLGVWSQHVVGWVDLASTSVEADLLEFKDHPKFVGIRHVTQDEPDDDFIVRDDVIRGLKTLEKHAVPFDLLFYTKHLRHAGTVAKHVPELPLVIDHLSKPGSCLVTTFNLAGNLSALSMSTSQFKSIHSELSSRNADSFSELQE